MSVHSPAQLRRVPGARDVLLVLNHGSIVEAQIESYRARLTTAISSYEGKTWKHFQNIESSLEGVYCPPEPINPEWVVNKLNPRDADLPGYPKRPPPPDKSRAGRRNGSFTYPCVHFHGQNLLIGHADLHYDENGKNLANGRVRVVPISWLYGGKMPAKS